MRTVSCLDVSILITSRFRIPLFLHLYVLIHYFIFAYQNRKHTLTNPTVLVAGQPLDQKVVQYGPFVLNSEEEVYQAMMDFQTQSNGFERAKGWKSEIGKTMVH